MKFYLSSEKVGNEGEKLRSLVPEDNPRFGYIPNALDFHAGKDWMVGYMGVDFETLRAVGIVPEMLDLKEYFGKPAELQKRLAELGGVWVAGGNTFLLRQAFRASGLDDILKSGKLRPDFVYGGYSAGSCILCPDLTPLKFADDPNEFFYEGRPDVIWEGLGLIDHMLIPHFDPVEAETGWIGKVVQYCKANNIPFKTISDGEVLIIE